MCVQALGAQFTVKRLDEAVVGWFSGSREVQGDIVGIGPKIEIAGDKFAAVINPDRLRITSPLTDTLQRLNHIFTAIREPRVAGGAVAAGLSHNQPGDPQKLADVLIAFADASNPPVRLPLGSDTVAAIEKKHAQDAAIPSEWRTVSVSTDFAADK